ncbi:hypothetical protein K5V21_16480 [Clostridium sardiniense]|uniref:HNH endonuclease n=1 Tax=Clostridium sardiniense TaxID=29369 RepID=A0ABS7L1Y2_CLOSR|nr:hypothetical protein [Clostridium sardiniense]MBY0757039.1 hypothetical protein [Clostridium sardiniense]MDQ0462084.1 hypothetical protein [Clostridium sardiniense]
MKLNFPTRFDVEYPSKNKNYYGDKYRKEIESLLLKASNYYCMYCGKDLKTDNNVIFNIEHSIEKSGYEEKKSVQFLKHCKFNLSAACPSCNQKYKTRMIEILDKELVNKDLQCSKKECTQPCEEYLELKDKYLKLNKIILQPLGVKCEQNGEYEIEYDLLKQAFSTAKRINDPYIINFIRNHISRFQLNKEMSTNCIVDITELIIGIIDEFGEEIDINKVTNIISIKRSNNIIGDRYIKFIKEFFTNTSDLYAFCELIIVIYYI